jgi:hypothetical protein
MLPNIQVQQWLMLRSCSFLGWGREFVAPLFNYNGSQKVQKLQARTIINILRLSVGYRDGSTCRIAYKPDSDIETGRSSQTWRNLWVYRNVTRVRLPRSTWSGGWTGLEFNRTVFSDQFQLMQTDWL